MKSDEPNHTLVDLPAIIHQEKNEKADLKIKEKVSQKVAEIVNWTRVHLSKIVSDKLQNAIVETGKKILATAKERKYFKLIFCSLGVFVLYLLYSILQEEIV